MSEPRNMVSSMPARVQQPVGEDVAALAVGAELDLVHGQERDLALQRHRLDRADQVARVLGADPLLAGDQGGGPRPLDRHHAVVDLARQQAQRETHDPAAVGQHPFDREMRLPGVGRTQDR